MTPRDGGRRIGRYVLHEPLGIGGSASVHLALAEGEHPEVVAAKRLHEESARKASAVARLLDEVRLARRIDHPNVVRTRDFVSDGADMLTVMDYVHGEPLSRLLASGSARPPLGVAIAIVRDVLAGLSAAHEARDADGSPLAIVHRDVTPENVLVGEDGVARITDFGVAKAAGRLHLTEDGGVRGKLAYLAPEQIGGDVEARTDVYAVGLVLWEMLVGERMLQGETEAELVTRALAPPLVAPSTRVPGIPPALDGVVLRALAPEPNRRFPSAAAMAEALVTTAGAVASRAEVGAWVRSLAAEVLDARADSIRALLSGPAPALPPSRALPVVLVAIGCGAVLAGAFVVRAMRATEPPPAPLVAVPVAAEAAPTASSLPAPVVSAEGDAKPVVEAATARTKGRTPPPGPSAKSTRSASCDPPWLIDDHGIRRYNPACL